MTSTAAKTMTVVTMSHSGGPEVLSLSRVPVPTPGTGEVLIKVAAAGVNRPDLAQRQGTYPPPPGASPYLGLEVAGTIAAVGEQTSLKVGDRVCALVPGGGYAEYCTTPEVHCLPLPEGFSLVEAAALPETYFTVWANVFQIAQLQAGERFLVHGGTSGIGTTAIQLAKAFGATVYATVGSDEKAAACLKLGADAAINYRSGDFVEQVKALSCGVGAEVILDMVGGDYTQRNIDCLASGGRLVQIAVLGGAKASIHLPTIMQKRLTLTGSTLRPRSVEAKGLIARELKAKVWPLLAARRIAPVLAKVFALADVAAAHRYLEEGQHIGKVMLQVAE